MNRSWAVQRMMNDATLTSLVTGGIHESTSLNGAPASKPFIMYRVIAHRPDLRGDDSNKANKETFLFHVHDVPGDYMRIDNVLLRIKALFSAVSEGDVICGEWLEDSEDFRDEDMGTILRYSRVQLTYKD